MHTYMQQAGDAHALDATNYTCVVLKHRASTRVARCAVKRTCVCAHTLSSVWTDSVCVCARFVVFTLM